MKACKRIDFIKLPAGTIYSRTNEGKEYFGGLYSKTTGPEYGNDWVEQNLISEIGFPNGIKNGSDAFDYNEMLIDTFQEFKTDLECGGRDGCFDDSDIFIVWDKQDIAAIIDYLTECIK